MLEWVLPGWSNPAVVVAFLVVRAVVNALLTLLVVGTVGRRTLRVAAMVGWIIGSPLLQLVLLRPGGLGLGASYVALSGQFALLVLAGWTLVDRAEGQSRARRAAWGALLLGGSGLLLLTIPLYGEAFVAP